MMQEPYFIVEQTFTFVIIYAIVGFFYIRKAFKNNIKLSHARISQWTFSVVLSIIFGFLNLEKIDLIFAIPIFYAMSFTYFGSFIAIVTISLLNNLFRKEYEFEPSKYEKEAFSNSIIRRLSLEIEDNIQNNVLKKTNIDKNQTNEIEGMIFSIFVTSAFYVLIVKKEGSPKAEIDKVGNEMRAFFGDIINRKIIENKSKENNEFEIRSFEDEYDNLNRSRFNQYFEALQNDFDLETMSRLIGMFAENYFVEPINEDDKKLFIENMAIMLSQYIERLTSEIKW